MDIATHFLVPYASALAAFGWWRRGRPHDREKAALALIVGLAGFSPDLDSLVDPLSEMSDSLYWLQHRGVSHTLVGAPVFGLLLAGAAALLAHRWPARFGLLAWRWAFVPAAILGSWTHLILDFITYAGVPLLWPFAFGRWTFPAFHWLVIWLLPIGALALALHAWGKVSHRGMVVTGVLFVATLVVLAGVRLANRPADEPEGALLFPRSALTEWSVLRSLPNGSWEGHVHAHGTRSEPLLFVHDLPEEATDVVARLRDTDAYRGFLMGSFGPEVVRATPENGTWNVTISDVAQRFAVLTEEGGWTPTDDRAGWGYVAFRVHPDGRIEVTHRGW